MPKLIKNISKKAGLPPGTLLYVGDEKKEKVKIQMITYDKNEFDEKEITFIDDAVSQMDRSKITWIKISGVHDVKIIQKIGDLLHIHPLVLEDIMNTEQRPKTEIFNDYIFIILKRFYFSEQKERLNEEQISIILGSNLLVSFQEQEFDTFNNVRIRIKENMGVIRNMGADFLTYSIIDIIVDDYFKILEKLSNMIEKIEEDFIKNPEQEILQLLFKVRREILILQKSILPLREVINGLEKTKFIDQSTYLFFKDIYDHIIHILDMIELLRNIMIEMINLYLSSVSNKLNEVMKLLTIVSTIFIPITFLASLYGMNFLFLPGSNLYYGFFILLILMLLISITMLIYFRKIKWL
ncbi:MAG: magnesium/cobalt transporter CorA [Promethearchaeota archaeon]